MDNRSSHRRKYRQQSHDQSHAEAEITPVLQGHPLVSTEKARWIDSQSAFLSLCEELAQEGIFAFDTEFIGEETYYSKICLVQVATTKMVALIDPFAIEDLTPLYQLIANPNIITVLHSGIQDLEPVARLLGKPPASIFDTQLVAGIVGYPWPLSLTRIIETILEHDVGGHFTFSQWDARPLSKRQCIYAADDVRYLLAIHKYLVQQLEQLERTSWAKEECDTLCNLEAYTFQLPQSIKRVCKNKNPKKKELLRMQAIVSIREEIAIKRNVPTRSIIPDECILALSRKPVEKIDQLAALKGFPRHVALQHGAAILEAIEQSSSLEPIPIRRPQAIERNVMVQQELEGAWSLFGAWCVGNKLSARIVTNRITFTDWYLGLKQGKHLNGSPLHTGWRSEAALQFANMVQGDGEIKFSLHEILQASGTTP